MTLESAHACMCTHTHTDLDVSDAPLTGDQEVADSIPVGSAAFFRGD